MRNAPHFQSIIHHHISIHANRPSSISQFAIPFVITQAMLCQSNRVELIVARYKIIHCLLSSYPILQYRNHPNPILASLPIPKIINRQIIKFSLLINIIAHLSRKRKRIASSKTNKLEPFKYRKQSISFRQLND